jgi:hypothetical protein
MRVLLQLSHVVLSNKTKKSLVEALNRRKIHTGLNGAKLARLPYLREAEKTIAARQERTANSSRSCRLRSHSLNLGLTAWL